MARDMGPGAAAAITVAVTVPGLFTFFCPPPHQLGDQVDLARLRSGQLRAAVCTLVLGAAAGAATRSPWPTIAALAVGGLIIWQYEQDRPRGGDAQ